MSAELRDAVSDALDQEVEDLQHSIASLRRQLRVQTTTLLSSDSTRHILNSFSQESPVLRLPQEPNPVVRDKVLARSKSQEAHNQRCLYRACAGATAFKVRDPDPNAVDGGNVLGVRIEVMKAGRFLRPYYVMLNRPWEGSRHLRVHRHTVPPCIPLPGLAARYLPAPKAVPAAASAEGGGAASSAGKQDLPRFVRALRREIVRHHNRAAVIAGLRRTVGLDRTKKGSRAGEAETARGGDEDEGEEDQPSTDLAVADIKAADPGGRQVAVEWADGRTGRLVMDDDGRVTKVVVFGERGERDRDVTSHLLADGPRIEDVGRRLASS